MKYANRSRIHTQTKKKCKTTIILCNKIKEDFVKQNNLYSEKQR